MAHAQIPVVGGPSDVDYYVKQARMAIDQVQTQAPGLTVAQTQTLPANLGALPSTYADAGKAAAAPSAETNQQILAMLVGIDGTLKQLLELERMKASAASAAAASH
ncbi:hypothetical protein [Burkholderia sp. SCN-KJ]|uniref:hypothetical protein n=1 Tax=Burkholderia sp. SCN-KJ TaxID=2969248 RepID=UPI00214F9A6E|nr:hypothetical protein [Burkholderia sp. SCN-KJ]MCR4471179.1 hypothetical protein [Burkholderia sp. SCN-KJ]